MIIYRLEASDWKGGRAKMERLIITHRVRRVNHKNHITKQVENAGFVGFGCVVGMMRNQGKMRKQKLILNCASKWKIVIHIPAL